MSAPKVIEVPKDYWVTRRLEGHSDWSFAFWRELFQNSVDGKAKRIDITVEDAPGKGAFGRAPAVDGVVRVRFADDGVGMDGNVLENVFFQPGKSTKKTGDGNTGGYGTARLMLCFSQVRYAIRTNGWAVEGDGSKYDCGRVDALIAANAERLAEAEAGLATEEEAERRAAAAAAGARDLWIKTYMDRGMDVDAVAVSEAAAAAAEAVRAEHRETAAYVGRLRADIAALRAEAGAAPGKGCTFEIDVNPAETESSWRNVSREKLLQKLREYLSMSQVPCKVFLNGEEMALKSLRGPAKRKLVAEVGGREVEFGTVHASQGEKAGHKGKIIVRSNGSAMFVEDTSSSHQVIVEIDPALSREVLTDNRDGMKSAYRRAMEGFVQELVVDTKSALEDKDKRKHIEVKGGKGKLRMAGADEAAKVRLGADDGEVREWLEPVPGAQDEQGDAPAELPKARYVSKEEYEVQGFAGVPPAVVDSFIAAVANGEETFLSRFHTPEEAERFARAAREAVGDGDGARALGEATSRLAEFVAATLRARMEEAGVPLVPRADRMADMHDVHMQIDDIGDDEKLKNAARRYHPNYWRRKGESLEGRGMQAHMLLACWTVCAKHAVNALFAARPNLARKGLAVGTGFYIGKSTDVWNGDGWEKRRTSAQHQERDGSHLFLLNPVFDDGSAAYDLAKERRVSRVGADGAEEALGLQDLEGNAIHEAVHVMRSRHDEEFANLQTEVTALFNRAACRAEMREAVDAVRAMYGRGKTRIQAMDDEKTAVVLEAEAEDEAPKKAKKGKARPAERLLAHAAPLAAMVVGTAAAPENAGFPADALAAAFEEAVTVPEPGVVEVDCDRIQALEAGLQQAAELDWEAPIDIDAAFGDFPQADDPALDALAELSAEAGAGPSPQVAARGTAWEAPIDLGQLDEVDAPALSSLADVAAEAAPRPEAALYEERLPEVAEPADPFAALRELADAPTMPDPVRTGRAQRFAVDFGDVPVVDDPALADLGGDFSFGDIDEEPAPAPRMR